MSEEKEIPMDPRLLKAMIESDMDASYARMLAKLYDMQDAAAAEQKKLEEESESDGNSNRIVPTYHEYIVFYVTFGAVLCVFGKKSNN